MTKTIQCKDIPDLPLLRFIGEQSPWASAFSGSPESVQNAMPAGTPDKLVIAKMRQLIKRRLVDGCACGCRGEFKLTSEGREFIKKETP